MKKIKIAKTDIAVSPLCMGGCPLGGYGWGNVERKDLVNAVKTAVDNGINVFDTSDTYGLGESERVLADAFGVNNKNVVISTKFGVRVSGGKTVYDNTRAYALEAIDNSLKRLGRDYVDIYYVHYRDGKTPLLEIVETMEILKKQGKIRYYGLSNIHQADYEELKTLGKDNPFVAVQDEYSLACRKNEKELITFRDEFSLTPFTWGSLGQGVLTGKYDKDSKFESNDRRSRDIYVNFHDKLNKNLGIVEELKKVANEVDKPISAVAIRWILDYLKQSVAVVGAKSPKQVLENIKSLEWTLSDDQISRLEKVSKE